MSSYGPITFNLLFNSIGSFAIASLAVALCLWLFRVPTSRLKLWLLSLPLAKLVWETVRGVPAHSYLYTSKLDLWRALHRSLVVGAGFFPTGPQLNAELDAIQSAAERGRSKADVCHAG